MIDTEQKLPTDEEVIAFYKSKIAVLKARVEFQELDTQVVEQLARKYEALSKIAHFTNQEKKINPEQNGDKSTSS